MGAPRGSRGFLFHGRQGQVSDSAQPVGRNFPAHRVRTVVSLFHWLGRNRWRTFVLPPVDLSSWSGAARLHNDRRHGRGHLRLAQCRSQHHPRSSLVRGDRDRKQNSRRAIQRRESADVLAPIITAFDTAQRDRLLRNRL